MFLTGTENGTVRFAKTHIIMVTNTPHKYREYHLKVIRLDIWKHISIHTNPSICIHILPDFRFAFPFCFIVLPCRLVRFLTRLRSSHRSFPLTSLISSTIGAALHPQALAKLTPGDAYFSPLALLSVLEVRSRYPLRALLARLLRRATELNPHHFPFVMSDDQSLYTYWIIWVLTRWYPDWLNNFCMVLFWGCGGERSEDL